MERDMTWREFWVDMGHCGIAVAACAIGFARPVLAELTFPVVALCGLTAIVSLLFSQATWDAVHRANSFAGLLQSYLAPAAKVDPDTAVSPGLMRLLQPVTPLDFPPGDPLAAAGPTQARRGAVITPEAVATANSAIVYRCEQDGMVATPLACYLLGFYKAVEDLRKPPGYVVHVSMGPNPEIVAVFPQDP